MGKLFRPEYVTDHFTLIMNRNKDVLRKIRFHDLRHSCASLYKCFIYIIIYCYIISLKTALNQTILTPILSNLTFNTNYKITHFYIIWLNIG